MYAEITFFISAVVRHLEFDDVKILHPVINFHGPNIALHFHVDWFGSFHTIVTYERLTTDRQTHGHRRHLKPPSLREART